MMINTFSLLLDSVCIIYPVLYCFNDICIFTKCLNEICCKIIYDMRNKVVNLSSIPYCHNFNCKTPTEKKCHLSDIVGGKTYYSYLSFIQQFIIQQFRMEGYWVGVIGPAVCVFACQSFRLSGVRHETVRLGIEWNIKLKLFQFGT
jgi:hypothetical protein